MNQNMKEKNEKLEFSKFITSVFEKREKKQLTNENTFANTDLITSFYHDM